MESIERFFLVNLLRMSLTGVSLVLFTDVLFAQDQLSITVDTIIVVACIIAFLAMRWNYTASVLIITLTTLTAMCYMWVQGINVTTSVAVILLLGFAYSVLLKGTMMWFMHGLTGCSIVCVLIGMRQLIEGPDRPEWSELLTMGMTYGILYLIISYSTGILKDRYDQNNHALLTANDQLWSKAREIEAKNRELLDSHEDINKLNKNLEQLVMERTAKVHAQNEMLLKYTYTNAHYLRGPVARLLGLINIQKLEPNPDYNFFFTRVQDQALEIDDVVKQINAELEEGVLA
jgi:signal transduction histidine kinase